MKNLLGAVVNLIFVLLACVILVGIVMRIKRNYAAKIIEVPATVVDKQTFTKTAFSKNRAPEQKQCYVVTFLCEGKKRTFAVSELSFAQYTINEKGTLKYQGTRLLDWK